MRFAGRGQTLGKVWGSRIVAARRLEGGTLLLRSGCWRSLWSAPPRRRCEALASLAVNSAAANRERQRPAVSEPSGERPTASRKARGLQRTLQVRPVTLFKLLP